MTLRQKIEQEIRERGPIPFSRYMELCLYDPELGYYSRAAEKFGKGGDFYTSSDVHAVFGRLLARQFEEMWRALGSPAQIEVLELGPGRGLFAQDVLDWSEKKFPDFYRALHYTLVETSPSLRQRLEAMFRERIAAAKSACCSRTRTFLPRRSISATSRLRRAGTPVAPSASRGGLSGLPAPQVSPQTRRSNLRKSANGRGTASAVPKSPEKMKRALAPEVPIIVFANEFFDALPVEVLSEKGSLRISTRDGRFVRRMVRTVDRKNSNSSTATAFIPKAGPAPKSRFSHKQSWPASPPPSSADFSSPSTTDTRANNNSLGRHVDTVMTYRRHSATPDPYQAPGEQDITAHVNFTALAAAASQAACRRTNC